jgi:hypothetical protein
MALLLQRSLDKRDLLRRVPHQIRDCSLRHFVITLRLHPP